MAAPEHVQQSIAGLASEFPLLGSAVVVFLPPEIAVLPPLGVELLADTAVEPPLPLPPPVAPPGLCAASALKLEPPPDELQAWSNVIVPASSRARLHRARAWVAFRVVIRIMSSVVQFLRIPAIDLASSLVTFPAHAQWEAEDQWLT